MSDGVVILGSGLAGLSAAYHMDSPCRVFEAEDVPGGLLRTRELGGSRFDCTGHLLHLKDGYARRLVTGLLAGNLRSHVRKAAIYTDGVFVNYPFQANTYGLTEDAARECVDGFMLAPGRDPEAPAPENFEDWIEHYFGIGIASKFMLPYNRKLWRYALSEMGVEGIAPFVPIPTVEEVRRGATAQGAQGLGYNASFYYPETGGIYALVEAILPHVKDLSLSQRAVEVDPVRKTVLFDTGYTEWYDRLVSTIPLPELIKIIKDCPAWVRDAARKLRFVSVYDISLGVAREGISPYHWVYFPGPEFSFYRAGFLSNFSEAMAPAGSSAMYVEVSHRPDEKTADEKLVEDAVKGLERCGLLLPGDDVPVRDVLDIKYAYAVSDRHSRDAVPAIMDYLRGLGILSIGRYGAWEYSSMEDALLAGRAVAEELSRRAPVS